MTPPTTRRAGTRWVLAAAWVLSVALALTLGWWAAGQATRPPRVETQGARVVTATAQPGVLTVEQAYGVQVAWRAEPLAGAVSAGTLTSLRVGAEGASVAAGDVLYTVDLAPVVALPGDVPSFRALGVGTAGPDVRQLEAYLVASGRLDAADDRYTEATARAVRAWERDLGLTPTGAVPEGRVVFVPRLPAVMAAAPDVRVGSRLAPGAPVVVSAVSEPEFSVRVLPEMMARITPGTPVSIDAQGTPWSAEVDRLSQTTDAPPATVALLRPAGGADSICGATCALALSLGQPSTLPGRLILVPRTGGPQVPTAAVRSDASGRTCVVLADRTAVPVTVRASARGVSIVDGVEAGAQVVVTGLEDAAPC